MTKLVLDDIGSTLTNTAATTINSNNNKIETALENTLSRDGSTPNNMQADLDMDSNDILNVDNVHANTIVLGGEVLIPGEVASAQIATQAEAEAGVNNTKIMTPLRTKQAVTSQALTKAVYDPQNINNDAFNRANHTGTQTMATISDLAPALDDKVDVAGDTMTGDLSFKKRLDTNAAASINLGKGRTASGPLLNDNIAAINSRSYLDDTTFFTTFLLRSIATENHDASNRGYLWALSNVGRGSTAVRDIMLGDEQGIRGRAVGSTYEHLVTMPESWGISTSNSAATNDAAFVEMFARINTTKKVDGGGNIYPVTALPADISRFTRCAFKIGSVIHVSKDFLRHDTAKITDGLIYTAWAEDKCYLVGDQIRVWTNEKESHADGTGRIVLFTSDDNGSSYAPGEYLDLQASGRTLWCAGFAGTTEYLIVRVPAGTTDVAPYTYERWSRTITLGAGTGEFNGPWSVTPITFPTPAGFTGQPVMVISFTAGHSSSIVVGTSYGEGAAVARSTDGGATWTSFIVHSNVDSEEPSVKYDSVTQRYYGFVRNGGSGNPRYWHSGVNDLSTISVFTAPAGTFGTNVMADSNIPLQIKDGRIHAFGSYRSGTLEGAATDELTSAFYMDLPVFAGNVWAESDAKIYRLGTIPHRETGGASACGVGSIVIVDDKVHLFYGMEERTGTTTGLNRIANIYQTVIFLTDRAGMFDFRNDLATSRASGPLRKMPGGKQGFAAYLGDFNSSNGGSYPAIISGRPNFAMDFQNNTISAGVATLTGRFGFYLVDTEASAATDDLDTITNAEAQRGDVIMLGTFSSGRDVTVKHATGNIRLNTQTDKLLSNVADRIMLMFDGSNWVQVSFSDNVV